MMYVYHHIEELEAHRTRPGWCIQWLLHGQKVNEISHSHRTRSAAHGHCMERAVCIIDVRNTFDTEQSGRIANDSSVAADSGDTLRIVDIALTYEDTRPPIHFQQPRATQEGNDEAGLD